MVLRNEVGPIRLQVRLAAAEHLLRSGDRPVGQVGLAVGFATPAHFATSFAARHGQSPSAYRKGLRSNKKDKTQT